ncbi:hypothetical protein [Diaphorina citri associated C virus]|nr:hypothetical protein [Diaphorina citri associated C virus]
MAAVVGNLLGFGAPPPEPEGEIDEQQVAQIQRQQQHAEARLAVMRAQLAMQEAAEALQARRIEHEQQAFYHLCESMIGKQLDKTWKAYATTIIRDYLDRNAVQNPQTRLEIIEACLTRFIHRVHATPTYTIEDVLAIRNYNRDMRGELDQVVWWNPLTWHLKLSISENQQGSSPVTQLYSVPQIMTVACGIGLAAILGKYCISRLLSSPMVSTIIPKIEPQLLPPTPTGTPPVISMNITTEALRNVIGTCANSSGTQLAGRANSMLSELTTPPSVLSTLEHWKNWNVADAFSRAYSHLQR